MRVSSHRTDDLEYQGFSPIIAESGLQKVGKPTDWVCKDKGDPMWTKKCESA